MSSFQEIEIVGFLGGDPVLRHTQDGTPVCNFNVATDNTWTDKEGVKHEETTWFKITCWRRLAEVCSEYLAKGRLVFVKGRMDGDKVEDARGNTIIVPQVYEGKAKWTVTASRVLFLGGSNNSVADEPPPAAEESSIPF